MMKWVFTVLIALSVIFGVCNGRIDKVSNAAMSESANAITLCLNLVGSMCLWCGVMQVAKKSGLTQNFAKLLSPITSMLFKGLKRGSVALEFITMNITANLFGLGNAATPLGLRAMGELSKSSKNGIATNHMIMLVVINTASLQLIPTTVATLRLKYGAVSPLDILPCVLISSLIALSIGVISVLVLNRISKSREKI